MAKRIAKTKEEKKIIRKTQRDARDEKRRTLLNRPNVYVVLKDNLYSEGLETFADTLLSLIDLFYLEFYDSHDLKLESYDSFANTVNEFIEHIDTFEYEKLPIHVSKYILNISNVIVYRSSVINKILLEEHNYVSEFHTEGVCMEVDFERVNKEYDLNKQGIFTDVLDIEDDSYGNK